MGQAILSGATHYTLRKEPNSANHICLFLLDILTVGTRWLDLTLPLFQNASILPLHGSMSPADQKLIFGKPPKGFRYPQAVQWLFERDLCRSFVQCCESGMVYSGPGYDFLESGSGSYPFYLSMFGISNIRIHQLSAKNKWDHLQTQSWSSCCPKIGNTFLIHLLCHSCRIRNKEFWILIRSTAFLISVSDPYLLNPNPDPAKNLNPDPEDLWIWIRIQVISKHYWKITWNYFIITRFSHQEKTVER